MLIKFGVQAHAVKEYKDMLVSLGYLHASTHNYFGRDSEQATKQFQADHGLVVDGIIGPKTANAIVEEYRSQSMPNPPVTEGIPAPLVEPEIIKYGSRGIIVKLYKDLMVTLGYLESSTHDIFRRESERAIRLFQSMHELVVDGIIGENTSKALLDEYFAHNQSGPVPDHIEEYLKPEEYPHINSNILSAINKSLQDETPARIELVKEDLKWVMPHGLYVFGQNLYNTDLAPQPVSEELINGTARRHPGYYTNGRLEFQLQYIEKCKKEGIYVSCCDCSGKMVGLYRKLNIFPAKWDSKAHWLFHTYCHPIHEQDLRPGDLLFKRVSSGRIVHVAMYLGWGYISEAVGTAYGIQITDNLQHVVRNHANDTLEKHTRFNVFGRPKFLA
jgi:hypothetical protein